MDYIIRKYIQFFQKFGFIGLFVAWLLFTTFAIGSYVTYKQLVHTAALEYCRGHLFVDRFKSPGTFGCMHHDGSVEKFNVFFDGE